MAGRVAPSTLEQIRAANDIVDVIGAYFPLKRAGANFVALCPFHKEKSPSFNVNPQRQIFHCFGCHKGGDVFTFVREYENLSFMEAVRRLAERANLTMVLDEGGGDQPARHLKDNLLELHEQITRRWHACLLNEAAGQPARDYLAQRGVATEAVVQFRLGFAPEVWDDTVNWARSKSYPLELVEQAGLILRKEQSQHYYDRFRGRLIFPIADEQGRVIGFSGRVLDPEAKAAKYVNSPETPIFQKSRVFFGLDKARRALLEAECAVVCEGQLDLMACHMAGLRNVVAPQGTAFTADHARILKRYVEEVVLCFDSDTAGQTAAVRALDSLLASSLAIRVAVLPSPHDPDSYIREFGGAAFQERITQAAGFFEFYLDHLCALHDAGSDKGRVAILGAMGEAVLKTQNQVLIDTHSQRTAQRLGVSAQSVRAEFAKLARGGRRASPRSGAEGEAGGREAAAPPAQAEFWLLRILLLHEDLAGWAARHLDLAWVRHSRVRELVGARLEAHHRGSWTGLAGFLHGFEDEADLRLLTEAGSPQRDMPEPERTLKGDKMRKGLLRLMRDEYIDRRLAELQREALRSGLGEEEMRRIEAAKAELRELRRQELQPLVQSPEEESLEEGAGSTNNPLVLRDVPDSL